MKKSRGISLTLMAGLAAACSGESAQQSASAEWGSQPTDTRVCADSSGRVVPDEECARPRTGGHYPFLYYYGATRLIGAGGAAFIRGGQATRVGVGAGHVVPPSRAAVSRGGLGGTARSRSGGYVGG